MSTSGGQRCTWLLRTYKSYQYQYMYTCTYIYMIYIYYMSTSGGQRYMWPPTEGTRVIHLVRVYTCICAHIYICIYVHILTYISLHVAADSGRSYSTSCTCVYVYMCVYIHEYIYIYWHIHRYAWLPIVGRWSPTEGTRTRSSSWPTNTVYIRDLDLGPLCDLAIFCD